MVELRRREIWAGNKLYCILKEESSCHDSSLFLCPDLSHKGLINEPHLEPEWQILVPNKPC